MKKLISIIVFSSLSLSLFAQNTVKFTGSLLWRVSGNGLQHPSYIFGTNHLEGVAFAQSVKGFNEALESSLCVVGEMTILEKKAMEKKMKKHYKMPKDSSYQKILSEEEYETLHNGLKSQTGAGLKLFGRYKPPMINSLYSMFIYSKLKPEWNMKNHVSVDEYVQEYALENNRTVLGLETIDDQIQYLFYSEPLIIQAKELITMVKDNSKFKESIIQTDVLYREGNLYQLYELAFNDPDDPAAISDSQKQVLLDKRNASWLAQLPAIMAENPSFIAVGALHLAGEEGLLFQLDKMGYTVEAVK